MVRLEHANLVSKNMAGTLDFLQTAFPDWKVRGRGESEWYGKKRQWLHFGNEDYYITINEGNQDNNRDLSGHSPGLAHIGFCVDNVNDIISRMQSKGYEINIIGADHPYRKTVYFVDPSGFEFEFIEYNSDLADQRNMYDGETSQIQRMNPGN